MRVATAIFSFAGGCEIAARHLPIWKEHTDDLLVVFPHDSASVLESVDMYAFERSNKYGLPCLRRQLEGMRRALRYNADLYVFTEYDGFMLRRPAFQVGLQANIFQDERGVYQSNWFPHFPWVLDAKTLKRICDNADFEPFGDGFVDRWLAGQCDRLEVQRHDFIKSGEGFSRNTIQTPEERAELLDRVRAGAYAIHGVKDAALLAGVIAARDAHDA